MDLLNVIRHLYAEHARLGVIIETLERVYEGPGRPGQPPQRGQAPVVKKATKPKKRRR